MKKAFLSLTLLSLLVFATSCKNNNTEAEVTEAQEVVEPTTGGEFNINTEVSVIEWKGSKPTGTHHGTINLQEGSLIVNGTSVEGGKAVIDMTTIQDHDLEGDMKANLENHLKGTVEGKEGDFFDTNKFPTAMFEITEISENEGKTMVSGNLTMKDQTHNITFPAVITHNENSVEIKSESFTIDRTLWGVNYGSKTVFDNLGDKFINDEIELTITVVANS